MKKTIITCILGTSILSGCVNPMVEQHRGDTNKPIIITDYYQAYPNSAGGIKVYLTAFNMTDKPIKYFDFWAKHYDRVDELQTDDITGETSKGYRFTGPYLKEKAINGNFGPSFYDFGASCMVLDKVEVTYMDNTKQILDGEVLKSVIVSKGATCRNLINR
ncbi:hypothetical protein L4D13_19050 [Photobacterium profundum]|uniref:hypothetical protein n=1 Tax=Photobacterium profundum TaxID=74109 RepID=UPI003D138112